MQSLAGSLVMLDMHTKEAKVFWNGVLIPKLIEVDVNADADDMRRNVRLRVYENAEFAEMFNEMRNAGITVKVVKHV